MANPENRDSAGRFVKGQSGNPGGRKPMDEKTKKIFESAAPKAAKMLVNMMEDETVAPKTRVKAAEVILDRAYGKPVQAIEGGMDNKVKIILKGDLDKYGE